MRLLLGRLRLWVCLWLFAGGLAPAWASGMQEATPALWYMVPLSACAALGLACYLYKSLLRQDEGNSRMKEIAQYVREGAMAYLRTQYATVSRVFLVLSLLLAGLAVARIQNPFVPVAFLTGGFFSGLCGYIGMKAATHASARTAQGARTSLDLALRTALRGGGCHGTRGGGLWFARHGALVWPAELSL